MAAISTRVAEYTMTAPMSASSTALTIRMKSQRLSSSQAGFFSLRSLHRAGTLG